MKMHIIELHNLTKKFGDFTAVDTVSFDIQEGEIFGFLGPNGAGKSTTLNMLSTLLEPTSGEAKINNFSIKTQRDSVRKSIGMVFQDPTLDDELTGYENMEMHAQFYKVPKSIRKQKILELLKLVEIDSRKDDLIRTYSGGMKRRLEIARALIHEPKVLFLDEPTLGLDPQTRNKLWTYIKDLNTRKGVTIILTTHYMEEADKLCNRLAIIDKGKIVVLDSPKNLKNKIGGDVITVHSDDCAKIDKEIKKASWYKSSKLHNHSLTLAVESAEKKIIDLVKIANKVKAKIDSLEIHKPTLEDVFLYFTGKTIREEEASEKDFLRMRKKMGYR